MAVTFCESFGLELLQATHNFSSHTFKMALFSTSATLDADTTAYSTTNEISATGYSAGGTSMTLSSGYPQLVSGRPQVRFETCSFTISTSTAMRYGLVYNSSASNKAVLVLDFGSRTLEGTVNFTFPASGEPLILLSMGV
jgi:hypothetical protein